MEDGWILELTTVHHRESRGVIVVDLENAESDQPALPTPESRSDDASGQAPLTAAALVDQMVVAGEWPEPALLEKIVQAGDAAVEPLIAVVRTYPRGWPEEALLHHAIGLLSMLRPPRAILEFVEIIRRYQHESAEDAARALAAYGPVAFEPVLEVICDPAIPYYSQTVAIDAARGAAHSDPDQRVRLAEVLRSRLAKAIERGREEIRQWKMREQVEDDEDDEPELEGEDFDEDDQDFVAEGDLEGSAGETTFDTPIIEEPELNQDTDPSGNSADVRTHESQRKTEPGFYEEVTCLVGDLAGLADPLARELIKTAFREEMVEEFFIDEKKVEELYRRGGATLRSDPDWLSDYRVQYQQHHDTLERRRQSPKIQTAPSARSPSEPAKIPVLSAQETIRNVGPKLGRNDPCWCGSGKKYKKCHFGKDQH